MKTAEETLYQSGIYGNTEYTNLIIEAMNQYAAQFKTEWISAAKHPLFIIDEKGNWECTEAGNKEFIAAVQYEDRKKPGEILWWIRHCVVVDRIGLSVITDDDTEPAGWSLDMVSFYQPVPSPPKNFLRS